MSWEKKGMPDIPTDSAARRVPAMPSKVHWLSPPQCRGKRWLPAVPLRAQTMSSPVASLVAFQMV